MFQNVKNAIPDFLGDEIVYCDVLTLSQRHKSCLILLRNLHFCEFQNKTPVNSIDLSATCLAKIKEKLVHYDGIRGKWFEECQNNKGAPQQSNEISFGKLIYQNFDIKKLYLLIKCWSELVILQRTEDGFMVVKQFEQVTTYKLVHGKIKFQAMVQIFFQSGTNIKTDLQDTMRKDSTGSTSKYVKNENFKQLMERIRSAKTELLVHKSITQKDFQRLKSTKTFGVNFLRSLKLDEKMLLARCGDIWFRFTPTDYLIIGVPLINNASATAFTAIKAIKPIFKTNEATLTYSFHSYQLQQRFSDLESMETFFQCEDEAMLQADTWSLRNDAEAQLMPESFMVVCIKLQVLQLLNIEQAPLFIYFDIEKDISSQIESKSKVFHQQLFIKNIKFTALLYKRKQYEISFMPCTLHQDFLAIASTGNKTKLALTYETDKDLEKFELLLSQHFDFEKILRSGNHTINLTNTPNLGAKINMNEDSAAQSKSVKNEFAHTLYYNNRPTSIWHGTLVVKCRDKMNLSINNEIYWTFYTNKVDKTFLLIKHILTELVLLKCNIKAIEYPVLSTSNVKIIEFENALRNELNFALLRMCSTLTTMKKQEESKNIDELLQQEMKTDLLARSLSKQ